MRRPFCGTCFTFRQPLKAVRHGHVCLKCEALWRAFYDRNPDLKGGLKRRVPR